MNFTSAFLNAAYAAIRYGFGSGAFDRVGDLIKDLSDKDMPGSQKKTIVIDFVENELGEVIERFGPMWQILLDLVIAIVRWRFEKKGSVST